MAIVKFAKDMAIIQKLDDEPNDVGGLTAAQLKAKFDEAGEAVKAYLNEVLIPALTADGAANDIGAALDGVKMSVQDALDLLHRTTVQSGNLPMGGAAGQVLVKRSDTPYDAQWDDALVRLREATQIQETTADALGLTQDDPTVGDALGAIGGILSARLKLAAGSYVGTGAYGAADPNTLTFDFKPSLVLVCNTAFVGAPVVFFRGAASAYAPGGSSGGYYSEKVSWSDNSVSWYYSTFAGTVSNVGNDGYQLNREGNTYYYVAIGV